MRPVLLEMHGFGSFRQPTSVAFDDVEHFALVGPTGSGKSTVIDGLTFALFGSVPRWDDRRAVGLALAPSASRGTVRLLFDVGGARYVVVRELRRSASGAVNQKNARLERLVDAAGRAEPEDDTVPVAADSQVTAAVEQLLGLTFEHFRTCVVLPQGDFADFLHAKAADRQKILVRLLGLGVYDTIKETANAESGRQEALAQFAEQQLAGYADATDDAVQVAVGRVHALELLGAELARRLPRLQAAAAERAELQARADRLDAEVAQLRPVRVPDDADARGKHHRAAVQERARTRSVLADAERDDDAARAERDDAPPRAPLLLLQAQHAELTGLTAALPGLREVLGEAEAQRAAAGASLGDATGAAAAARAGHERALSAEGAAADQLERLRSDLALLSGLELPDDVASLGDRLAQARRQEQAAQDRLADAEADDLRASQARQGAPDRDPLEHEERLHAQLAEVLVELAAASASLSGAAAARATAAGPAEQAQERLAQARDALDDARRDDLVAGLRPHLRAGHDCPVCEQPVAVLPADLPAGRVEAAQSALRQAQERADADRGALDVALSRERDAAAVVTALQARRDALDTGLAQLIGSEVLHDDGPSLQRVRAALADLDRLAAEERLAGLAVREARAAATTTGRRLEQLAAEVAAAGSALQVARDPLVGLGAPAPGDDLLRSWRALLDWAGGLAGARLADAGAASAALEQAQAGTRAAVAELGQAQAALAAAERRSTSATTARVTAEVELASASARSAELATVLGGAAGEAEVTAQLSALDDLEAAARASGARRTAAREHDLLASAAVEAADAALTVLRAQLTAVRDPLVALGAPALDPDDVLAGWSALADWAAAGVVERHGQRAHLTGGVARAGADLDRLEREVAALLTGHEVAVPEALSAQAAAEVALAQSAAVSSHDRLVERREQADGLRRTQGEASEAAGVAKLLGSLLRSDQFPRWLVAAALDVLVAEASATLRELSGGQFELAHEGGDFLVVDHTDADSRRPVKTLSGGETFQASLALALALSAQLAGLSASGAARLDSIFLDEGFGTLDEATLDLVATTLEGLAAGGTRMVGVVTHVPALAERVPVRFRVSRDAAGSHVRREDR